MEQEMCIQFTVFHCKLSSAPCMHYDAVSNTGSRMVFFCGTPALAAQGEQLRWPSEGWGCVCRTSALARCRIWREGSEASHGKIARVKRWLRRRDSCSASASGLVYGTG